MDRATFYKKLSAKTDAELVHIINEQREDYQQTAIDVVEEILNERELHDQINEIESNQEAENHPKNYDKTPLWGGIGLFIFNVFLSLIGVDWSVEFIWFIIIANRLVTVTWCVSLSRRFKFNEWKWVALAACFGSIILIVIHFTIMRSFKNSTKAKTRMGDSDILDDYEI